MPQPGGCVKKWATTGRLCQNMPQPGGCQKNGPACPKKSKPGGCVKKDETGRLPKVETGRFKRRNQKRQSQNARSRPKKVETARLRQKNARSRPKAENARLRPKRPVASIFLTISLLLSLSCSNHQYIHHQSLCAQYCTLNAKECQKNETTPQTFMK
jgi:hypothetical protein